MSDIFRHTKKCCLKFFRKLSISNIKSTGSNECNAKYKPQKNHSVTLSPLSAKVKNRRKNRKREEQQEEDLDEELSYRKSYIKNCIKKKLNKNYEKQVNCFNDENVVFTDNKIYISLTHRRSSFNSSFGASSTSSRLKDRRIIYPSSGGFRLTGFLRDYDFNYDYKSDEERKSEDEKLKFDVMNNGATPPLGTKLNNIVFEKVKFDKNKKYISREEEEEEEARQKQLSLSTSSNSSFLMVHMTNTEDDTRNSFYLDPYLDTSENNNDSLLTNTTFIAEWNNFHDFESSPRNNGRHEEENEEEDDDVQWKDFIEVRKKGNVNPFLPTTSSSNTISKNLNISNNDSNNNSTNDNTKFYNTTSLSDDSGIGRSATDINKNLKTLETWLDDEDFDNSFNEELERRVQVEIPNLYKNSNSSSIYYNNINNNNHCAEKFS